MTDLIFCLDSGTTAVKAGALTLDGRLVALHEAPNAAFQRRGERAEQNMQGTRDAAWQVLRACAAQAGQAPGFRPRALVVTAQGDGVWPVDGAGRPVGDAITWLDGRGVDTLDELERQGALHAITEITGARPTAASPGVQLAWLQRHEPQRYAAIAHVLRCKEWLFWGMTGEFLSEPTTAMIAWGDWRRQRLAPEVARSFGLAGLMERLPAMVGIGDSARPLGRGSAQALGLPEGLPVMLGPGDTQATAIGLGVGVLDGVTRASVFGTSGIHVGIVGDPAALATRPPGSMLQPLSVQQGKLLCLHPSFNGSTALGHVKALTGAASSSPLSGVVVHPFFEPGGERAPVTDPHACASVFGLTAQTADAARVQQATREALAFNARMSHEAMGEDGAAVALGGGLARDPAFASLLATILKRPVLRRPAAHAGLLGLGLLAVHHLGLAPLQATARAWLAGEGSTSLPDEDVLGRFYQRKFILHKNLIDAIRPFWAELGALQREAERLSSSNEKQHETQLP